jgi:hypothetical protein
MLRARNLKEEFESKIKELSNQIDDKSKQLQLSSQME